MTSKRRPSPGVNISVTGRATTEAALGVCRWRQKVGRQLLSPVGAQLAMRPEERCRALGWLLTTSWAKVKANSAMVSEMMVKRRASLVMSLLLSDPLRLV